MSKVKEKQKLRRGEIIEACIPLIGARPFEEIGIADICAAADISVGSFYHYFAGKSDILVGLLGLIDEYLEAEVFPLLRQEDEGDNLQILAEKWAGYVVAHGIERSRLISSVEPADTDPDGVPRASYQAICALMERGLAKGQFSRERTAEELTGLYLLTLRGVSTDWSRRNASFDLTETMKKAAAIFIRGIR